ncbi:MAG TPA: TIGR03118 family protein, partial [Pyrinomonadaceae bacterium]
MIRPLARQRRVRRALSLALTLLFAVAFLPPPPAALRARAQEVAQVPNISPGSAYRQTNLLSDVPGLAPVLDPLLVNPWGISLNATSPFWVANNRTSTTQLIRDPNGAGPVVLNPALPTVTLPGGLPTGTVANTSANFVLPGACASAPCAARFLFASITGNIVGWNPNAPAAGSTTGVIARSKPGHVFTGLAINNDQTLLYAADFANNHIDVFDAAFADTTVTGGFADATVPAGYAPFNIQNVGGSLYVAYAKVGPDGLDEAGVGNGYVRKFDANGVRDPGFAIDQGQLNSPWGLVRAPASFGVFGGALLVGNFGEGNGSIHAYNPSSGAFLGTLKDESNTDIVIDELWDLKFGNGGNGGDVNTLYFAAGPGEEQHGLFGKLNPTTATATSLVQFATDNFGVDEAGGFVDFTVVRTGDTSGAATVNYNTFDYSPVAQPSPQPSPTPHASQKSDYEIALGTLRFEPGETSKTFRVLLVNDRFVEG